MIDNNFLPSYAFGDDCITDVSGIEIGHFTDFENSTGCSVILTKAGAVASVDVRGAAPGTRETDLMRPENLVERIHAIVLSGGSAFGLDASSGVMRWLDEREIGLDVGQEIGKTRVPLVASAVLFDLHLRHVSKAHQKNVRPDALAGYAACENASAQKVLQGCVGAGTGACIGKLFGLHRAMKSGIGSASLTVNGFTVGALVACNAVGDVLHPETGEILAGARTENGKHLLNTKNALLFDQHKIKNTLAGTNTTIGVIATNAPLTKAQAKRLAMSAHDGLARSINPIHTQLDGDTLFAISTHQNESAHLAQSTTEDLLLLSMLSAEVTARATIRAVCAAQSWKGFDDLDRELYLPSALEIQR